MGQIDEGHQDDVPDFDVALLIQGTCSGFLIREGESAEQARWALTQEIRFRIEEGVRAFNESWEEMDFQVVDIQIHRPLSKDLNTSADVKRST